MLSKNLSKVCGKIKGIKLYFLSLTPSEKKKRQNIKIRVRTILLIMSIKKGITLSECAQIILKDEKGLKERDPDRYKGYILENSYWESEKAELELIAKSQM